MELIADRRIGAQLEQCLDGFAPTALRCQVERRDALAVIGAAESAAL